MSSDKQLESVLRHIERVREDCETLGKTLIEEGEPDLGRQLVANGLIHDNSKLHGIEWLYLNCETKKDHPEKFALAVAQHQTTNPHHPEYWYSIEDMPRVYVAEMVCDWRSRSSEFSSDLRDWIKDSASKRYKFSLRGRVYKEIKEFVDLLVEKPFV